MSNRTSTILKIAIVALFLAGVVALMLYDRHKVSHSPPSVPPAPNPQATCVKVGEVEIVQSSQYTRQRFAPIYKCSTRTPPDPALPTFPNLPPQTLGQ